MARRTPSFEPHLLARALRPLVDAFSALDLDVPTLLEGAGIARSDLSDPDCRIPHPAVMKLWQLAGERSQDSRLGLHAALAAPLASFELHTYALLASRDLRDALRRACRYQRLIHESTELSFEEGDGEGVLAHSLGDGRAAPRQTAEFLATLWFRFGSLIAGDRWQVRLLCFDHAAPADTSEHTRIFGCPIVFAGGRTALHLPNAALDAPSRGGDPTMAALLDRHAALLLDSAPLAPPAATRLRAWAAQRLASGEPSSAQAAQALGLSQRSLRRRLAEEGTSHRAVIDRLRHEQSLRLLRESTLSAAEVGFLMGFSELSAFHRAFKRWTGSTPADYRRATSTHRS